MSKNGEILAEIVDRNALVVANGIVEKCEGVITRQRNTADGRCEKSVIDIVLLTQDLEEDLMSMKIDEEKKFVLTKIVKKKNGEVKKTESDHNIIETEFHIKVKYKSAEERNVQLKKPGMSK